MALGIVHLVLCCQLALGQQQACRPVEPPGVVMIERAGIEFLRTGY